MNNNIINQISLSNQKLKDNIQDSAEWFIFRYDWINPIINTEAGLKDSNAEAKRFTQFIRLAQGNESIYITLKGAIKTTQIDNFKSSYVKVEYLKDNIEYFKGLKIQDTGGIVFQEYDFGNFANLKSMSDDISLVFQTNQKVDKTLRNEFFLIPNIIKLKDNNDLEYDDNDIYYISAFTNHYDSNGDFTHSDITFTNIQFNLSNSGQTLEQHIYFNSPGGGYVIPKLLFNSSGLPIDFEISNKYIEDRGIKSLQFEILGNAAIAAIEVWGIPVYKKNNNWDIDDIRWYSPRKLLIQDFKLPWQETFFNTSTSSNSFYLTNMKLSANNNFQSYQLLKKDLKGDVQVQYQGILETDKAATISTNTNKLLVNDKHFRFKNDNDILTPFSNINVQASSWFYDGLQADGTYGCGVKNINLKNIRSENNYILVKDIMNLNSFITNYINLMPMETTNKIIWSLKDINIFGSFLNKITFGLSPYYRTIYTNSDVLYPSMPQIPVLIDTSFYDFAANSLYVNNIFNEKYSNGVFAWYLLLGSEKNKDGEILDGNGGKEGKIPLDIFTQDGSDEWNALFGAKNTTTNLNFTLTDKMIATEWDKNTKTKIGNAMISTIMLNQSSKIDNSNTFKVDETSYSLSTNNISSDLITDINGDTYIINQIGIKALGDGDIRITAFYSDLDELYENESIRENIAFQTIIKSQAQQKGSYLREWFTLLDTSFLNKLALFDTPFNWPLPMPTPAPENTLPTINTKAYIKNGLRLILRVDDTDTFGENEHQYDTGLHNNKYHTYDFADYLEVELYDFVKAGLKTKDEILDKYDKIKFKFDNLWLRLTGTRDLVFDTNNNRINGALDEYFNHYENQLFIRPFKKGLSKNRNFIYHYQVNLKGQGNDISLINGHIYDTLNDAFSLVPSRMAYDLTTEMYINGAAAGTHRELPFMSSGKIQYFLYWDGTKLMMRFGFCSIENKKGFKINEVLTNFNLIDGNYQGEFNNNSNGGKAKVYLPSPYQGFEITNKSYLDDSLDLDTIDYKFKSAKLMEKFDFSDGSEYISINVNIVPKTT